MFDPNQPNTGLEFNQSQEAPRTQPETNQSILTQDETPDIKTEPPKQKISFLSLALVALIFITTGIGIYLQLEVNATNQDIEQTQQAINAQAQNIITDDNQEVTLASKKAFLDLKSAERTFFKNVIQDLNQDIISLPEFRTQSFTINNQGQTSLNLVSTANSLSPLQDAAQLLDQLTQRTYFQNVFIPGLTQSLTESGLEQIQFNLQVTHNLDSVSNSTNNSTNDSTNQTDTETEDTTNRPSPIIN